MSLDLAWAAGLFDGEGCITIYRPASGRLRLMVRMSMVHEAALRKFQRAVQAGTVRLQAARGIRKPYWAWTCGASDCYRVLEQLRPFLVVKLAEADIAQAFLVAGINNAAPEELFAAARAAKSTPGNRRK